MCARAHDLVGQADVDMMAFRKAHGSPSASAQRGVTSRACGRFRWAALEMVERECLAVLHPDRSRALHARKR